MKSMKAKMKNKLGVLVFVLALLVVNIFLSQGILASSSGTIELSVEVSGNKVKVEDTSFIGLAEITGSRNSITPTDVANKIGVAPDIVKRDINDLRPIVIDDKMPSFPLLVIYGEGITKDKEKFKFYIGKLKKVELENNNLEKITVQYRGRLKFEDRLESYLIIDGNEEESIFKLVPVNNRQITEDEKLVAKMLVNFKEKTGSFSNLFGIPEIIDFEIVQLERKPLRLEVDPAKQKRFIQKEVPSIKQTEKSSTSEKDESSQISEIPSEIKYKKQKRFSLVDWFNRLFKKESEN